MKTTGHAVIWTSFYMAAAACTLLAGCATSGGNNGTPGRLRLGMPAPGRAKVIFVHSPGARYARLAVHDGDRLVAIVPYHGFGVYECNPGHHLFSAALGNVAVLEGDLLPNRIYYVEVHETHGWVSPGVEMHSIYPNNAGHKWKRLAGWLNGASEAAPDEADILHDRKGIDRYMSRVQNYRQKKYLTNPHREQIRPEHGQLTPIGSR